ncbi:MULTISPECIES: nucleotidyltransferase [Psychrilyobacter]|uniref:tRNA(Met) cytidine acetate ligase n=1 Tax=Psychrilyobacter piezotolerans TaxID=2293438 RepID=A0ABX9KL25_9FUSO|nr:MULTISPECIES: nucleotidyltransferase [Psychrilyobacter]MCS5420395.1 nucleotidyltransferase [Psychrilyobacter sp. S5]NDI76405.1 nucleotidyltransferase [Psychrilyobacter piezotolerans]RDE66001.1 nucleotidyltransferase [Psychrilyobacter sp. S5]REI43179.1 nucleotidyltransferase [Psychrilyobacter piezotolerans]
MRATGIVVEYNPFHNGHKLHLMEAKKSGDLVIAVMSGNFLQRGEPAIYDKWTRARMALKNGVDLVVELPVFYSAQSAEIFSHGAVDILDKLGAETLVFGSESSDLEKLKKIAYLQIDEKKLVDEKIKERMEEGVSYPNAINSVIEELLGEKGILKPNDILGVEYIKAIRKLGSSMEPTLIERKAVGYHDKEIIDEITSATSIREMIKEGRVEEIKRVMPAESFEILGTPTYLEKFYPLLRYEILNNYEELKFIADMEIGLDNRVFEMAVKYPDFHEFYKNLMTKRYTNGRIQRVLAHILLKIDKKIIDETKAGTTYVKILGFSQAGSRYLKEKKENLRIKPLSGLKNVSLILDERERELLNFEIKCDRIYGIVSPYEERKFPIIMKSELMDKN